MLLLLASVDPPRGNVPRSCKTLPSTTVQLHVDIHTIK